VSRATTAHLATAHLAIARGLWRAAIRPHPEARRELLRAGQWYETRRPGLGKHLRHAVEASLKRIVWNTTPPLKASPARSTRCCTGRSMS
jgi:hypothetical protein